MDIATSEEERIRRIIFRLGLLLVIPATLNILLGSSLGIWFAPFPVWMFVTFFVFPPLPFIAPSGLFLLLAFSLNRGSRKALIAALMLIVAAALVHSVYSISWFDESVDRLGLLYTGTVMGIGTLILGISIWLSIAGVRLKQTFKVVVGYWFTMLWLAWYAVPWLDEAI